MYPTAQPIYLPTEAPPVVYATTDVAAPIYVADPVEDKSPIYVTDAVQDTSPIYVTDSPTYTYPEAAPASADSTINRQFVDANPHPLPPAPRPNDGKVPYAVVVRYLQLANKEIERLYKSEKELNEDNAQLEQKIHTLQQALADQYIFSHNSTPALTSAPQRPYLGLEVTEMPAQNSRIPGAVEVVVKHVVNGHGAYEAGVQTGDILRKWNGLPIRNRSDFGILVHNAGVGSVVKLQIERAKGQQMVLRVEVQGVQAAPIQTPTQRGWATPGNVAHSPSALPPPTATPARITDGSSQRHYHDTGSELDQEERAISTIQLAQLNDTTD